MTVRSTEANRRQRKRAFARAGQLYRLLLRLVGGPNPCCAICGATEEERPMQLDHVNGKNWRAKDFRYDQRVKRYRDELKRGVKFRVLCIDCNAKDGRARQMEGRVHERQVAEARVERRLRARALDFDSLIDGDDVPF